MANSIILKKFYDFLTNSLKLLSLPLRLHPGVCLLAEAGPPGQAGPRGLSQAAGPPGEGWATGLGQARPRELSQAAGPPGGGWATGPGQARPRGLSQAAGPGYIA